MDFEEAKRLVFSKLGNVNLQRHSLAVSAVMRHLARRFGENEEMWALAGILHDLDYEETLKDPDKHTLLAEEWLKQYNLPAEVISGIKAHCNKAERNSLMNKAIYAADPVTGFIVACALIKPEKKLAPVEPEFAMKRMKEKRFAAGANREQINSCAEMGLSLEEFFEISLNAMKEIADELGL
jgi:putative nucleotidyltransferase with HDIG domain